ncbi:glycine--tRNA ligase subunit beta [Virgibacillus phasianinus]|uniref:Glycine--tRNA ligase beta subunit n=1 Tax=Virgibacillus phasianinus TaxID=2017483 RepID=A0A220U621_9BACI|nr:glycine--tRNA ligase subunit beta [Virgibacillus phasianinus]ASK63163.1 glycine--tRNA ligase subunit beta [Virgibacillus phasianinus]
MTKDALFEIGLEELPARFIDDAEAQLKYKTEQWLHELRLSYQAVESFSTPRRLAVLIKGLDESQKTIEEEAKGPALKIAQDENGNWTKAAIGFTKGQGKSIDDIYTKDINGTTYIFVQKRIEGKTTYDLLTSFGTIIESIQFQKNMRWAEQSMRYARPIRWLLALYGEKVVPFEVAQVKTGNQTFGHRFLGSSITIQRADAYQNELKNSFVIADSKEREDMILSQINALEAEKGFNVIVDDELLQEVRNLVEYPTVFAGSFENSFLQLPKEVLITSMKVHQRYFPVESSAGELLATFIGVRNGIKDHIEQVVKGNEKVIHARLSDAEFFFEEDKKHSIDFYQDKLKRVVFQEKLGTITDKVNRVVAISSQIAELLQVDRDEKKRSIRTAEVCKFDLATNMVNEFTNLQGVIGEKYALYNKENAKVATAIREHYLPLHSDDPIPNTVEGAIVSVADKLDTIVGCISIGLIPTGSQDPYGLRRQAVGILRILDEKKWNIALEDLLNITRDIYRTLEIEQNEETVITKDITDFFRLRANHVMKLNNVEADIIDAVIKQRIGVFHYTIEKAKVLAAKRNDDTFKSVNESLIRVLNLSKKGTRETDIDQAYFGTESEASLYRHYQEITPKFMEANQNYDAVEAMNYLATLATPIHDFFENNMVMTDDMQIRTNRMTLLKKISDLVNQYADLTMIEWKQQF